MVVVFSSSFFKCSIREWRARDLNMCVRAITAMTPRLDENIKKERKKETRGTVGTINGNKESNNK